MTTIKDFAAIDRRFDLEGGAGSDAVHVDPQYGYAVTRIFSDDDLVGTGFAYTLGQGTELICDAIKILIKPIIGRDIQELMAEFGCVQKSIAEHPAMRWLGPHKGVIHSALASITIACFDLWAKSCHQPLWKLLPVIGWRTKYNIRSFVSIVEWSRASVLNLCWRRQWSWVYTGLYRC